MGDYLDYSKQGDGYSPYVNPDKGYNYAPADKTYVKSPNIPIPEGNYARVISGFLPSVNGLHYPNDWPHVPYMLPILTISNVTIYLAISDAHNGMCGGMAYAVRDLFEAKMLPPPPIDPHNLIPDNNWPYNHNPKPYCEAFQFIYSRLVSSFVDAWKYYSWMVPAKLDGAVIFRHPCISWMTIMESMPIIKETIDNGHLCPLGLISVKSLDPRDIGGNHQVLAWGYNIKGSKTIIKLYDPNFPGVDNITITFDSANVGLFTDVPFKYSTGTRTVFGFFPTTYTFVDPKPIFKLT